MAKVKHNLEDNKKEILSDFEKGVTVARLAKNNDVPYWQMRYFLEKNCGTKAAK